MRRLALTLGLLLVLPASAAARAPLDVQLFAHVPSPGAPEGVSLGPDGNIYTATLNAEGNGDPGPGKVFAFSKAGKLLRTYTITGQDLAAEAHGLTGLAFDGEGRLYIGDLAPARVIQLDLKTGKQRTYGTMRDIKPCAGGATTECSPGVRDFPAWPDYLSFGPDGSLFETDSLQGLIWRFPKGGGKAQIWFKDRRLATEIGSPVFGPSALELGPDHRTLYFTTVGQEVGTTLNAASGAVWRIPIGPGNKPGTLEKFWESKPVDAPGGIAFGNSGKLYVAQSGLGQIIVLSSKGTEITRGPDAVTNQLSPVPVDSPLGVAFEGQRLIVANSSFLTHTRNNWALLDVFAGESGVPEIRPPLGAAPCTTATGRISGRRVGPARLDWTRAHNRRVLRGLTTRRRVDRFCLTGGGAIRAAYRRGRTALLLTSSKHYKLRGLRVGARASRVKRKLKHARRIKLGPNTWYLARGKRSRLVFKLRHRRLTELGIAAKSPTRRRPAARRFLLSFR